MRSTSRTTITQEVEPSLMIRLSRTARRAVLASGAAVVVATAALGTVAAQQTPTPSPSATPRSGRTRPTMQAFIDALAARLGISSTQLQQAVDQTRIDLGVPQGRFGFGHGGPRGFEGGRGVDGAAAAQALGITVDQLRQNLAGKSLAQVAQDLGKNPADVATALKNAANQRIDQAVAAGRLTADQATQQKQQVSQRIDQQMTEVKPQGGAGTRGGEESEDDEAPHGQRSPSGTPAPSPSPGSQS